MRQQSSRFIVPSWVKWTGFSVAVLFILILCLLVWLYMDVQEYKTANYDEARQLVVEATENTEVSDVSIYYGDRVVHMVEGQTTDGSKLLFIVNTEAGEVVEEISLNDKLSLSKMKSQWKNQCTDCQFKKIQYAYEEGQAVYEITYVDTEGRYVLDYYQLNGEKFDQRFAFQQSS